MFRTSLAALAALSLCAAAHAIPSDVMNAYRAYMAAIEAEDLDGAAAHAETAYQAGLTASIDTDTMAALAENRAQIYTDKGDGQRAASAWIDLADLLQGAGAGRDDVARAIAVAASENLAMGNSREGMRYAEQVIGMYAAQDVSRPLFEALFVQATIYWQRGGIRSAGSVAQRALAIHEAIGGQLEPSLIQLSVMTGSNAALVREPVQAAFHLGFAADLADVFQVERSYARQLSAWANYSRRAMTPEQRTELFELVALSDHHALLPDGASSPELSWRQQNPGAVDVSPRGTLTSPRYPTSMWQNDMEGVALVTFDITPQGRTENVEIVYSIPHPDFGTAISRVVHNWRYNPATLDGVPIAREGMVTSYEFTLERRR